MMMQRSMDHAAVYGNQHQTIVNSTSSQADLSRGSSNVTSEVNCIPELRFDQSLPTPQSPTVPPQHSKPVTPSAGATISPPAIKKQISGEKEDLAPAGNSTFENSADTFSRSNKEGEQILDSFSEEEDAVYVPFEYQGDGRKREAKRHKQQALVARDEIEIDRMIRDYQNSNSKIVASEQALDELRTLKITKKELQSKRNRFTAQLSRDRQKLEMTFLKAMCVNY